MAARQKNTDAYHSVMANRDPLDQFLDLCLEIHRTLLEEGKWPWPDSHNSEDLVESEDTANQS
ncbi:MAG: hypothetical protein Gyms2KO_03480 [Gymnodinialimonas sp.]